MQDIGLIIKQIHESIQKIANEQLRDRDLTYSQLRILMYIYKCEGYIASLKDIERHFQIAQPTVAGILKRLVGKGLIKINKDNVDRRVKNASLLDKGVDFCDGAEQFSAEIEERLLNDLSAEDVSELRRLLIKIYSSIAN